MMRWDVLFHLLFYALSHSDTCSADQYSHILEVLLCNSKGMNMVRLLKSILEVFQYCLIC